MTAHYHVRHNTTYRYASPVSVCQNVVCMTPRNGARMTVQNAHLQITPEPTTRQERTDAFGNRLHMFSIEVAHETLTIEATAQVSVEPWTPPNPATTASWETIVADIRLQRDPRWLEASSFVYDSPLVQRSPSATAFARRAFTPDRPILEAALALTTQIYQDFLYKPGATNVDTDSEASLELRHGVCQDFAHVGLAAMRSLGIPARYVSGYLRTEPPAGQARLVGADESHAWFSIYTGSRLGWVDLDPTNNMPCNTDHIVLAHGRDYSDIAPVRGTFIGGAAQAIEVSVDVQPLERDPSDQAAASL